MTANIFSRKVSNAPSHICKRIKYGILWWLSNQAKHSVTFWMFPNSRPWIWRKCGARVGKNVCLGWEEFLDVMYAKYLTKEDDVWITNRAVVICYRIDISNYKKCQRYKDEKIYPHHSVIKRGSAIGTAAMIMPGVNVGEGAVIGAYSLDTKDVSAWSVVAGAPSKMLKTLEPFDIQGWGKTNLGAYYLLPSLQIAYCGERRAA